MQLSPLHHHSSSPGSMRAAGRAVRALCRPAPVTHRRLCLQLAAQPPVAPPGAAAAAAAAGPSGEHAWATTPTPTSSSSSRTLLILGIESSCDDTAAAVVTSDGRVLGEAIASQAEIHAPWGGVVPSLAQQAHQEAIDRVVSKALADSGLQPSQLDAVAATIGPGLSLCLEVGVRKARSLSRAGAIPFVPVHHMEAHALVARMAAGGPQQLPFPFLCLLVSGGHNLLVLVKGPGNYTQLGSTLDDALGEAYDKVARMLGLQMNPHGGAALEKLARQGDSHRYPFAVPMKKHANCDFSYAGLKTSVRLCIEKELGQAEGSGKSVLQSNAAGAGSSSSSRRASSDGSSSSSGPPSSASGDQRAAAAVAAAGAAAGSSREAAGAGSPSPPSSPSSSAASTAAAAAAAAEASSQGSSADQIKADIAASFQRVAVEHLVGRVRRAICWAQEELPAGSLHHLVVAGGVAANQYVRQQLTQVASEAGLELLVPPSKWCTDNGVMVAWAGIERFRLGLLEPPLPPLPEGEKEWMELRPRWPLTGERHARSMPAVRSMKQPEKMATSLTDLTQAALQQQQQQQEHEGQGQPQEQPQEQQRVAS